MLTVLENSGITKTSETSERFWELETIGIADTENTAMSLEEEPAVADFKSG